MLPDASSPPPAWYPDTENKTSNAQFHAETFDPFSKLFCFSLLGKPQSRVSKSPADPRTFQYLATSVSLTANTEMALAPRILLRIA